MNTRITEAVDRDFTEFLQRVQLLMRTFDVICSLMSQTEPLTDFESGRITETGKFFGYCWRQAFPGSHVPIKVHIVETNVPQQMEL